MNTQVTKFTTGSILGKVQDEVRLNATEEAVLQKLQSLGIEAVEYLNLLESQPTLEQRNQARARLRAKAELFEQQCIDVKRSWGKR